jgi:hypothetical protein
MLSRFVVSGLMACAILTATLYGQNTRGTRPAATPAGSGLATSQSTASPAPPMGLKDVYAGKFHVGCAGDLPGRYSNAELANIKANYNIVTPENCRKPQPTYPAEGTYNFAASDALVQWCQDNNIKVWGHPLAWHAQTAGWFCQGAEGQPVTREVAMERLKKPIRTMVANLPQEYRVGVINVSVAGAKIELWEKDTYKDYLDQAESWMQNICTQYDGNPYKRLVDMAKIAQEDGVIKGILLHQGESNPNDQQWCNKVKGIYDNLIQDLNLKPEEVPFLAGELKSAEENGRCAAFNTVVLANLPRVLPNSHITSSKGCKGVRDGFHFSIAGFRELGKRYAIRMLKCHGFEPKDAPAVPPAADAVASAAK